MPAAKHKFIIEQGATWLQQITWQQADGTPVDNTGMTARMQIRSGPGGTLLSELTTENGGITLGGVNGNILLARTAAQTDDFAAGRYRTDLELVNGATVTRILEADVEVIAAITRGSS